MRAQRRSHTSTRMKAQIWKFTGKMLDPNPGDSVLCEPAQPKRTWTFHQSHVVWKFKGKIWKNAGPRVRGPCAPAQSKRTWTFHKSHFVGKFTGKMPDTPENSSIKHRAFYCDRKDPFSVATLFEEPNKPHHQWIFPI